MPITVSHSAKMLLAKYEKHSDTKPKKHHIRPDLTKKEYKEKIEEEHRKLAKKSKLPTDIFVAKNKHNARVKNLNKARHF
jgi:hypothetical protein